MAAQALSSCALLSNRMNFAGLQMLEAEGKAEGELARA